MACGANAIGGAHLRLVIDAYAKVANASLAGRTGQSHALFPADSKTRVNKPCPIDA